MPILIYSPTGDRRNPDLITEESARQYNIQFGSQISSRHDTTFYIDISSKHMTLGAVKKITKYFESTIAPDVKKVNISNLSVQGGHKNTMFAFRLISKALSTSKLLQVLVLSNNNLGSGGIKNLQDVLAKTTLELLDISHAHLGKQDAEDLFGFLHARKITHFSMSNNPNVNAQAVASFLKKCTSLVSLELSNIRPGRVGTLAITKAIRIAREKKQAPLEWVNINHFDFGVAENLEELKATLGHHNLTTLIHVNVMNSGIPSAEHEDFADLLYYNNSGLDRDSILLGNDSDGDCEEQESQFVELSMRG